MSWATAHDTTRARCPSVLCQQVISTETGISKRKRRSDWSSLCPHFPKLLLRLGTIIILRKKDKNKSLSTVGHTILHNALQIITTIKSIQPFDCSIGHMHRMMLEAGTTSFIQNQIALGIRSWVVTYINVQFFVYIHLLTRQQGVHLTLKRTNKQRLHHEKPLMVQLPWPRLKLHVPASTCNLEYFSTFC